MAERVTAEQLASRLGITGKALRGELRRRFPDHPKGAPWVFTAAEAGSLEDDLRGRRSGQRARPTGRTRSRSARDEAYVIDLCDEVLGEVALRQHRFAWLVGDPGKTGVRAMLPVDAYYPTCGLVVEYRERQHSDATPFFDKPDHLTVSGVYRGEQRRIYDARRSAEIPRYGLRLVVIDVTDLAADRRGRLLRDRANDLVAIGRLLAP